MARTVYQMAPTSVRVRSSRVGSEGPVWRWYMIQKPGKGPSTFLAKDASHAESVYPKYTYQVTSPHVRGTRNVKANTKAEALKTFKDRYGALAAGAVIKKRKSARPPGTRIGPARDYKVVARKANGRRSELHVVGFDEDHARANVLARRNQRGQQTYRSIDQVRSSQPCERPSRLRRHFEKGPAWQSVCDTHTYVPSSLFTTESAKVVKSRKYAPDTLNAVMYMAPDKAALAPLGIPQNCGPSVCGASTDGCVNACLAQKGQGGMPAGVSARVNKTKLYLLDPAGFVNAMRDDISRLHRSAIVRGITIEDPQPDGTKKRKKVKFTTLAVRPNGTSDIKWEDMRGRRQVFVRPGSKRRFTFDAPTIFDGWSDGDGIVFYDYTKYHPSKRRKPLNVTYSLTYSYNEEDRFKKRENHARAALDAGWPVAAVFRSKKQSKQVVANGWSRFPGVNVVDGDKHDLRFRDPSKKGKKGVIVALYAKGKKAETDASGFVQDLALWDRANSGFREGLAARRPTFRRGRGRSKR